MRYRPEVDGLRTLAVVPVILFHAGFSLFAGGFLGVDVFFVISGYLITNVIAAELETGRFSIAGFYERRIRRILPALIVVMALCTVPAFLLMLPDDLENFGQSLVATTLWSNNVLLFLTTGYFDMSSEFKPLVHTWSLGVEEHYYIGVPLLMMAGFQLGGRRGLVATIAATSAASFASCLWAAHHAPDANFYLLPSRAWELGAGALTALGEPGVRRRLAGSPGSARALGWAGVLMIVAPLLLFDGAMKLPSWPTLAPILGVCLVLLTGDAERGAGRWLAARPMVAIGLLSYSAYLYHQPIFVFTRIASIAPPSPWLLAAQIPVVFLLAHLSLRFVEGPFRDRRRTSTRFTLLAAGLGSAALLVAGYTMYSTSGFHARWPELADGDPGFGARQNAQYNEAPFRYRGAAFPAGSQGSRVMVIGDSFARDFINMGLESGRLRGHAFSYLELNRCADHRLDEDSRRIAAAADFIVLALNFETDDVPCLDRVAADLGRASAGRVVVLGTKGFGWNNNAVMLIDPARRHAFRVRPLDTVTEAEVAARRRLGPDLYASVLAQIEDAQGRVPVFTPDRKFISQDRKHFTRAGARHVGALAFRDPILRRIAEGRRVAPARGRDDALD